MKLAERGGSGQTAAEPHCPRHGCDVGWCRSFLRRGSVFSWRDAWGRTRGQVTSAWQSSAMVAWGERASQPQDSPSTSHSTPKYGNYISMAGAHVWIVSQSCSPSGSSGPGSGPHPLTTANSRTTYGGRREGLEGSVCSPMAQERSHPLTHWSGDHFLTGGGGCQRLGSHRGPSWGQVPGPPWQPAVNSI